MFDFIDNASRYSVSQSLHRVMGKRHYTPGALVAGTEQAMQRDAAVIARGEKPLEMLHISLWTKNLREIDIFNWQEISKDMFSVGELEVALAASDGLIRRAIERGEVNPDHQLTIGERTYHYFVNERQEEIRQALGLPKVNDKTIRTLFLKFVRKMDMASSCKPLFLQAFLEVYDDTGHAKVTDVAEAFRNFYEGRRKEGLRVEKPGVRMADVANLNIDEVKQILLSMPFEKFERRHYFRYARDLSFIEMKPSLWKQLSESDLLELRNACEKGIESYYARLSP